MDHSELEKRIEDLEKENQALVKWQSEVNGLLSQLIQIIEGRKVTDENTEAQIAAIYKMARINRYRIDSLPYEMAAPDYRVDVIYPKMLSIEETLRLIIEEKKSIARLGDGEFAAIAGTKRWNFQGESEELGKRLREVLEVDVPDLLVGLNPNFYSSLQGLEEDDADGVRAYMRPMVRRFHSELLKEDKIYANAVMHRMDNDEDVCLLKKIWEGRKVTVIEGQYTRMGVGNDLLDGALEVKRILAPSESAFDRYQDIYDEALKRDKDTLFLISLGPTATVLAYDLCKAGYQAVDIGHIDLIYEKYLRGLSSLYEVNIPYKYCNSDEIGDRRQIEDVKDEQYEKQIVAKVY